MATQYERLTQFQRLLFKHHPSLKELALSNCGTLQKRSVLKPALEGLPQDELKKLATSQLRLLSFYLQSPSTSCHSKRSMSPLNCMYT